MSEAEVKRAVVEKALKDPKFRAELLKSPKAVIMKETGATIPESLTVKVVEDTASVVHFVVPRVRPVETAKDGPAAKTGGPDKLETELSGIDKKRADLIEKAQEDAKFKADLLKNPNATIETATGEKFPAGVTVKVVDDSATVVHLVLPLKR